ncbi:unnamed protein product, partial [Coffea canephora]
MADAAVSATIQVALQAVVSLAADHVNLVREFPTELERLNKSAEMIRGFLAGADEQMHSHDPRLLGVQKWLKQLEEEVFKADNVLDELNYENLRQKVKYQNQLTKKKVFFCFSFFNKIGFSWRLGSMIREINTNLQRIHQDAEGLGLAYKHQVEEAFPTIAAGAATSRQTDSTIVRRDVLGRDKDESEIVKKLLTETESVISVIPITGMGGLGKTTLAKAVYKNEQIEERLKGIVGSTLAGLNAKKGSWCLVTTRLQEVAIILSRHPQINFTRHELGRLRNDDCWSIMKKWANVGEEVPKELENMRRQVLRRCDGLPLAAKLIGGLLSKKRKEEWLSILDESLLNGDRGGIEQIIKVSFDHLSPAPVKKCFAYCSIFDQDTELEQDLLVELWMAEGFLQPDSQNERVMEKIGCEYLRTLLQTSLLEEVRDWRGTWYKMHDLVHDFAKSILNRNSSNQDRYLAVYSPERMLETINAKTSASLRTLFLKGGIADDMLSKFKYLHVLKLFGADAKELPTSIGKLIHLHLLDISDSMIRTLPESLCKLYSLQTLRIDMLEKGFPKKMSNLISMRHLHYHDYFTEPKIQMPSKIGRWTCLQTLEFFNIGRQEEGHGIQELGTLHDLKGSLKIRNLELVNGKDDAELAKLSKKPNLHQLSSLSIDGCNSLPTDMLERLCLFPSLDVLEISGNCPLLLVEKVLSNIANLSSLKLRGGGSPRIKSLKLVRRPESSLSIVGCNSLPAGMLERLCLFPTLQHVQLRDADNITTLRGMSCAACLKRLEVLDCDNLRELPEDLYQFQALEHLMIYYCPRIDSFGYPNPKNSFGQKGLLKSLERFSVWGCDALTRLPVEMFESCTSLRELTLFNCRSLVPFPLDLRRTPSLESFKLYKCPNLVAEMPSGFGSLTSLREVTIGPFSDYSAIEFDWAGLASSSSLRHVFLCGMPDTKSLPHELQDLTTITSLSLRGFGAIEALPDWLGNLASLEELILFNCQKLEYLPSVDAMERLKLRRLEIYNCPLLGRRCTPQSGSECHKISNIPE